MQGDAGAGVAVFFLAEIERDFTRKDRTGLAGVLKACARGNDRKEENLTDR
jgi:hypothetical protein